MNGTWYRRVEDRENIVSAPCAGIVRASVRAGRRFVLAREQRHGVHNNVCTILVFGWCLVAALWHLNTCATRAIANLLCGICRVVASCRPFFWGFFFSNNNAKLKTIGRCGIFGSLVSSNILCFFFAGSYFHDASNFLLLPANWAHSAVRADAKRSQILLRMQTRCRPEWPTDHSSDGPARAHTPRYVQFLFANSNCTAELGARPLQPAYLERWLCAPTLMPVSSLNKLALQTHSTGNGMPFKNIGLITKCQCASQLLQDHCLCYFWVIVSYFRSLSLSLY